MIHLKKSENEAGENLGGLDPVIVSDRAFETLAKHADWTEELKARYTFTEENAEEILRREVGVVFATVLEHAGVYKCTPEGREAFLRFVQSV